MKSNLTLKFIASATLFTLLNSVSVFANASDEKVTISTEDQKVAYAIGASFAEELKMSFSEQNTPIDKHYLISGFSETLLDKSQLSQEELTKAISAYSEKIANDEKAKIEVISAENIAAGQKYREEFEKQPDVKKTSSGLLYKIEKQGDGPKPTATDTVIVNYRGKLIDGREFDSSYSNNEPATFPLNGVIKGWTEGLQLLNEGGKATLVIPPELAYGNMRIPDGEDRVGIGPQSTLVFDVELLEVKKPNSTQ